MGAMGALQTVLPFTLAATGEALTAQGGLALFDDELPAPGSAAGYAPSVHSLPLILMLADGGRTLEDLRVLRKDNGLRAVLRLVEMPSSDATGDWLRRPRAGQEVAGWLGCNGRRFSTGARQVANSSRSAPIRMLR